MENPVAWRAKKKYREKTEVQKDRLRSQLNVLVAGQDVPCLVKSFRSMRFPKELRDCLKALKIRHPTPLQMQGLPVVLSGRDALMVSISREGKTLLFALPLMVASIQEEGRLKFGTGEGPLALIIVPSRELAQQIFEFLIDLNHHFLSYPRLKIALCTGGVDVQSQVPLVSQGVHILISTPGRLSDMLSKELVSLKMCRFLAIDEADRLLDLGFDEELKSLMQKTSQNLQIILTSPTIPKKMQDFASNFMKNPIFISHNRSSLLKLPIMQHSVWATEENKLVKLLEALIKTDPPVLVFCENKNESDKLEDYLNIRKIKCASLHGGKSQNSRSRAIQDFNRKKVDVLIATDIAAKGLGFRDVKHIVNFDLPKDIDSYIQRVCRAGAKAVISNLISNRVDKVFLKDLTAFLKAMGDKVPQFLSEFLELIESNCEICNSPGHLKMFCTVFQQDSLKYELPLSKVSLK